MNILKKLINELVFKNIENTFVGILGSMVLSLNGISVNEIRHFAFLFGLIAFYDLVIKRVKNFRI